MWHRDLNRRTILYNDTGAKFVFLSLREGIFEFRYLQEGYDLFLLAQKLKNDLPTPKITFIFALGTALAHQRSSITPDKINEIAENIEGAIREFITSPMFKDDPPLDKILFAMNKVLDWSPSERPFS